MVGRTGEKRRGHQEKRGCNCRAKNTGVYATQLDYHRERERTEDISATGFGDISYAAHNYDTVDLKRKLPI